VFLNLQAFRNAHFRGNMINHNVLNTYKSSQHNITIHAYTYIVHVLSMDHARFLLLSLLFVTKRDQLVKNVRNKTFIPSSYF